MGTNRQGMRKYRRFVANPKDRGTRYARFAVGNPCAQGVRRQRQRGGAACTAYPLASTAFTRLSRNDGIFSPILSEIARKTATSAPLAPAHAL